jgi:hypothetical protein
VLFPTQLRVPTETPPSVELIREEEAWFVLERLSENTYLRPWCFDWFMIHFFSPTFS